MCSEFTFPERGGSVATKDSSLVCEEYLRLLPGRRLACRARWKERTVFAKIFRNGGDGRKEWNREGRYFDLLRQRGVDTPALLSHEISPDGLFCILITEWLQEVETLREAWRHVDKHVLIAEVCRHLAAQHQAGMRQRDLHADNLVFWSGRILTIDCGRMSAGNWPLAKRRSLNNLALLLAQLHPMSEELEREAFQAYTNRRGWSLSEGDRRYFREAACRSLRKIRKRTEKKLFRSCTAFGVKHTGRWRWVFDRAVPAAAKLDSLNWDKEVAAVCGYGMDGTCRKEVAGLPGEGIVGAWFSISHRLRELLRLKWWLPSERAWIRAQALHYQNIPMEHPVTHALRSLGPLQRQGVVFALERKGLRPEEFFSASDVSPEKKRQIAEQLLEILFHLRWTMISIDSVESAVRVDAEGVYFPAPYRIGIHGCRREATERIAGAWGGFTRHPSLSPEVRALFESVGFSHLMSDAV